MLKCFLRCFCAPVVATATLLLIATDSLAQYRAAPGPYIGFYPFYSYRGFYSNGFSMYGPPVPTYAPVPGVFGGSDQRMANFWAGPPPLLSTARRHSAPYDPVYPGTKPSRLNVEPDVPTLPAPRAVPADAQVRFEVRVPDAEAAVTFDGDATRQTGTKREFESPPLERGKTFDYEVTARWKENGKEVTRIRVVSVEAGKRVVVDFTQPEPAAQVKN
ncbi:MAG: TIGR03000 domain-containing protein [Gemmataceae bacterium]|nr:TIGR03000 domain-containing protein [Gemmataceae bacterium]